MRRTVALIAVVGLLLVGLGATALSILAARDDGDAPNTERRSRPPDPAARVAPAPGLQPFYDQVLEWTECGNRECARVQVPLDYAKPNGARIELKLLRVPALDQAGRVGSLVVNPGGPGAPGTTYADQAAYAFGAPLLQRFDIVGFDPRGTGQSSPIDCLSDADLDAFLASDPVPDTPAEVAEVQEWSRRLGEGCVKLSGALAGHVSTVEAARDLDVIRAVLDERTLTYFGASYGTKLGATYADLYPSTSGRLVLDGAIDTNLDSRQLSLGQARGFQRAIDAYADHCVAEGDCYLGADREAALERITDFLDQVDAKPLTVGERELTTGSAFYGIVLPLYNEGYWSMLDNALGAALEGDGAALLQLSDLYSSRVGDTYTDNSAEAIWAINCLDDPSAVPVRRIPGQLAAFRKASPTFGDVFAWGLAACAGIQVEASEQRGPLTAAGAAPLLVIGTTRDPATPYEWAQALAEQLRPAVLVSRDGDGHTGYHQGDACVDEVVEAYLVEGVVPDGPVDCPTA
ncbi:alpha/beta hydrolase [Nocardioides daejeonensis]|uniref:alpha/beta hydrolase n=1 Tax=Nocardioides daejeonensis TaxID=1046556 RepID=UPI000D743F07|nr:alpha/beta hydrolase [Nocardioides daejeonensis]